MTDDIELRKRNHHIMTETYSERHKMLYKRHATQATVDITEESIELTLKTGVKFTLNYSDIIGCTLEVSKDAANDRAFLHVYHYPVKNGKYLKDALVLILAESSRQANEELGEQLERRIRAKLRHGEKILNYLILLNPASGTGQSARLFEQFKQLLIEANIKHKLVKTTHRGHAHEIGASFDLTGYDGLITVSGDGLFHEMINGLLTRDEPSAIRVGLIPAGSGNGLVNSFQSATKISCCRSYAMFQMLKFESTPLDLLHFESDKLTRYCMLSCMLGLVADIDHESDVLRAWGSIRFDIYAVVNILRKRKYPLKVELFDAHEKALANDDDKFWALCFGVAPLIDAKTRLFPRCINNSGAHMVAVKSHVTRTDLVKLWSDLESGRHDKNEIDHLQHVKVHKAKITSPTPVNIMLDGEPFTVSQFTLTDMPKRINSLFHSS